MAIPIYTPNGWVDDDGSGTVGTTVTADRMNHIEQGIADAHLLAAPPPVVTALPQQPVEGQEVYFQTMAMATAGTPPWRLRYRGTNPDGSANGDSYKWEVVGATPLRDSWWNGNGLAGTQAATGNFAWDRLAIGDPTRVTLPLAGVYDATFGASGQEISGSGSSADIYIALWDNATNVGLTIQEEDWARAVGAFVKWKIVGNSRLVLSTAGKVLDLRGAVSSAQFASFAWFSAFLHVAPIKVR